ncbi:RNA polymerase sigma factor (sigma-70 family) [Streptacidiphilus sp. MAP12-20]|uniref:RNA polymerase sigma factor n=1 Tax=Streptacidiphilus sp. MAP12-20 TaxID=3156299 RepID=UPI0035144E3D
MRARIRAGDSAAFGQLFEDHAGAVHRHALRMTADWAVAEDVVSLTFLEAWRLRARVEPDGDSLRPWLLGIATNVIRNTRRAARRHQQALAKLPPRDIVPDFAVELTGRIADAEQLAAAKAALEKLRPAEREVFALCVWEGLDHAAVAEALGKPVGTIRSRLSRARSRLRELTSKELAAGRSEKTMQRMDTHGQVTDDRGLAVRSKKETIR